MQAKTKTEKATTPADRRAELIAKQQNELAELDRKEAIRAELPESIRESARITLHKDHASVSGWDSFNGAKPFFQAQAIISEMAPTIVESEHWKNGCIACRPASINSYAKQESATMDGSHAVEISVSGGRGYGPDVTVKFWAQLPSGLVEMHLPVKILWKLIPRVETSYNNHGDVSQCTITWPEESRCVDSFRKFWSEPPSYNGSYYFADLPNFNAWSSNVEKA